MSLFNGLEKNKQFRVVYEKGKSLAERNLVLYWLPNNLGKTRFGFSIGKKVGNAVIRNRYKRILKEICRLNYNNFAAGFDCVIIARPRIVGQDYHKIENSLNYLAGKAGIKKRDE